MKTALVSGGAGFIGSHLCGELLNKKYRVLCVDNFMTSSGENVRGLLKNNKFELINQDVNENFFVQEKVSEIYHLASLASPLQYFKKPLETAVTNSFGTKKMLDLAKEKNARFFFASTSEIYGNPLMHPQKEIYNGNVNPFSLRACYDESKRFGETLCLLYSREFGVKTRIGRIFNTYGPKMSRGDGRVIPSFIISALSNKPVAVHGSGNQTRSFCYIDDMIKGIIKLMKSDYGRPVNLGNTREMKIIDVAKKIISMTNSKSKIVFRKGIPDDPDKRRPDISIAKRILKLEFETSLEEGLKKTISFFEDKTKVI